jgi:hypothetical protein
MALLGVIAVVYGETVWRRTLKLAAGLPDFLVQTYQNGNKYTK